MKTKPYEKYPYRSKRRMSYHGRTGRPVIHIDPESKRRYIMVRAPLGRGTRRMYLNRYGWIPKKHRKR